MSVSRLLSACLLLLLTACAPADRQDARVWPAPASAPAWAGYELAGVGGVSKWGEATSETWLTLRCTTQPQQRLERAYWPGAEWAGHAEWSEDAVTYHPDNNHPKVEPYTFTLEEAQQRIGCD